MSTRSAAGVFATRAPGRPSGPSRTVTSATSSASTAPWTRSRRSTTRCFRYAEEAVAYIDKFDYSEPLPDDVANLRNLLYSLITVSLAVELWKQPRVKHSANTILTRVS